MSRFRHQLPPVAAEYVAIFPYDKGKVRHLVGRFHAWLAAKKVDTADINTNLVDEFMELPWARELAASTKTLYHKHLYRYVRWLGERGHAPRAKRVKSAPILPKAARLFIRELSTTLTRGTTKHYETVLRRWYLWAESQNINTRELTRSNVVAFCRSLHGQGLGPETRGQYLARLRRYLFYLADEGLLTRNPMKLIRPGDFPKRPRLLPRALQPAVDAEIRARLTAAASSNIRCRGLLLMRHTGLRVGELADLCFDCVHEDHLGNHYLKVPLGKLKTERLVPLNDEAIALVRALQEQGRARRAWLLESPQTKRPYSTTRYHQTMQAIRKGIPPPDGIRITTHRMRHTFAVELLSGGLSLAAIQQLLGHRSMNMTLRYVSLTPNRLRSEYLAANTKARERYGNVPEAPPTAQLDERTAAETIAETVRQIKRDAAGLSEKQKARAWRAARQLKNLAILLSELGI